MGVEVVEEIEKARKNGGIGAILGLIAPFFFFIPVAGGVIGLVLAIIGLVLIVSAIKSISNVTEDQSIYKNYLTYLILIIVSMVLVVSSFMLAGGAMITSLLSRNPTAIIGSAFGGMVLLLAVSIIAWILMIIAAIYLKKSYDKVAEHTGVKLFATTALLFLIGVILYIVFVGGIIVLIASILQIIAFFSLPTELPGKSATS